MNLPVKEGAELKQQENRNKISVNLAEDFLFELRIDHNAFSLSNGGLVQILDHFHLTIDRCLFSHDGKLGVALYHFRGDCHLIRQELVGQSLQNCIEDI